MCTLPTTNGGVVINYVNNVVSQTFFSKFMFFMFRMHITFMVSIMAMNITVHFEFK